MKAPIRLQGSKKRGEEDPNVPLARMRAMTTKSHHLDDNPELTVFYDGSCPICRTEIAHYQRCVGSEAISYVDVSKGTSEALGSGLDHKTAMKRIHVRQADGRLVSGAKAFTLVWLALPRWRFLGRVASYPPVTMVLEGLYRFILPLRSGLSRALRHFMQV